MKRWLVIALTAGMVTLIANAEESSTPMQMNSMNMPGAGMGMQRQKMIGDDCGMMGTGIGMRGQGMAGGFGMMGSDIDMMADPEIQQMMTDHQKKMLNERMKFRKAMQKKMMSNPKVIKTMLSNILENPEALKKTLNDDPDLKAKLKKML